MRIATLALLVSLAGCAPAPDESQLAAARQAATAPAPVGLSLSFVDGQAAPLTLVGAAPRFLDEVDLRSTAPTLTDEGIEPLRSGGDTAQLDWTGATLVEELWLPGMDGTFTRERYWRGAAWMQAGSAFTLQPLDAAGQPVGAPVVLDAGSEQPGTGDALVRRLVARQLARGCAAPGDCSAASYTAEALIQVRQPLRPQDRAAIVPASATRLALSWTGLPGRSWQVPVQQVDRSASEWGYGLRIALAAQTPPANGAWYAAGEAITFQVTFTDGEGNRLHPDGLLPSYGDFFFGAVPSGLRYLDLVTPTRLYYALKHREANVLAALAGPAHRLTNPKTVVDPAEFFGPQVTFASTAVDGYSAVAVTLPPAGVVFGGFQLPELWALPTSDRFTLVLPADAQPGTYVLSLKARREFGGEASQATAVLEVPVGQSAPTQYQPKTHCGGCHRGDTALESVLHGTGDKRSCYGCHASLGIELDNALDIRVHTIHDRSQRTPGVLGNCSNCHVTKPASPPRGVPQ